MALSVVNNVSSLTAQNNLSRTSNMLSKSLERLSSGLKINRGADGPAGLVISEQQRAQITGLRSAIDNSSKAVSLVQTGEGALNEINRLLGKARSLAVDSANTGVNDTNALAANQAEINNILGTIDRIAGQTQFGTKKLFDGTAGFNGSTSDTDFTFLRANDTAVAGSLTVEITTEGERAFIAGGVDISGGLGQDEQLTINGVNVQLTSGDDIDAVVSKINNFTSQTGVVAEEDPNNAGELRLRSQGFGSGATITVQSNVAAATADSTGIGTAIQTDTGVDVQGTFDDGTTVTTAIGTGNVLTANGVSVQVAADAADEVLTQAAASTAEVVVNDQRLQFQIGANAGQTAKVAFDKVDTNALGLGANGAGTANLASIDVRSANGANDALKVIDQAINDVTTLRGRLGAFQQNTLEANANNLRTTLENTVAAESVIRDTDFAEEMAMFTKNQVMMQAGQTVLGNANQIPQLVASLLRG